MSDISKIQIENNILNIKDLIARNYFNLQNAKMIFLGDSYATGQDSASNQTIDYVTLISQYLNKPLNTDIFKSAVNGAGFTVGSTFLSQLQSLNIANKDEITHIIVAGGYNDRLQSSSSIVNAINNFVSYVKSNFPNAQIFIAHIGWSSIYTNCYNVINNSLKGYFEGASRNGVIFIKNCEFILHDYSLFQDDNFHPNQNGQNYLARGILQGISSYSTNVFYGIKEITSVTNISKNEPLACHLYTMINNEYSQISLNQPLYFETADGFSLNRRQFNPLISWSNNGCYNGNTLPNPTAITSNIILNKTDGSQLYYPCLYEIKQLVSNSPVNTLGVYPLTPSSTLLNNITGILIEPFVINNLSLYC